VQRLVKRLLESSARAALRLAKTSLKKEYGRIRPYSFDGGVSYILPIARIFRTIGRICGEMWSVSLAFICGEKFKCRP